MHLKLVSIAGFVDFDLEENVSANCFTIVTFDDDIFEAPESLIIDVKTLTLFFSGEITILDNDSEFHNNNVKTL